MKILNIQNYEIGNGIQATVESAGEEFKLYLQLPSSPDSQHSFISETDLNEDEQLDFIEQAVESIKEQYNSEELNVLTELGTLDYTITDELIKTGDRIYHVIDNEDEDNFIDLIECSVNSYYNVFLLEPYFED